MEELLPIQSPTKKELRSLRGMILIGVVSLVFFLYHLIDDNNIGFAPFYYILISSVVFTCGRLVVEWYYYYAIKVPETPKVAKQYTVDIFTTFCPGEPYEMIIETLEAIQRITYPHEAYLCDEANDPYLIEVCKKLGVHHVTRTNRINAKAGNINNALKYARGEICLILDPDHVPAPDFLDKVIPHFSDEGVGFVQVVQAYKNGNENIIAKAAAQQTYQFYGPMMMCMNSYGTVMAIGANCTFRRSTLDSIGGHAAGLAEDMNTAMHLHAKGWKSVYVPVVVARGLVPSTLSAYYKQQLKWSRGVFELLVTSYIKLFKHFTWRQKLHYGLSALHYLSGVFIFFDFIIPILSLFLNVIPFKMDMVHYLLYLLPLATATVLIRLFVQRWVMEDKERGFHVIGGLIHIGTWWIFLIGLFYTLIRKNVPYNPTPKDGNEANNWPLNIPNLVVGIVSAIAIVYGLYTDWNPYTFIMAGIAGLNCIIISFIIYAGRQLSIMELKKKYSLLKASITIMARTKDMLWKYRPGMYWGVRKVALSIVVLVSIISFCWMNVQSSPADENLPDVQRKDIFYTGAFYPGSDNGLSSLSRIKGLEHRHNTRFNIISSYVAWGDSASNLLPLKQMDSIYQSNALPLITWEPWVSKFKAARSHPLLSQDKKAMKYIAEGYFDDYLNKFSAEVKALKKPVFLRFAHEADNPAYPWSASGDNTAQEFKEAWKYVHTYFSQKNVTNVIWVWNPWNASSVYQYYPGDAYVDWLAVTSLNYREFGSKEGSCSFRQLYEPFRKQGIFRRGLPVMVAELGDLHSDAGQSDWLDSAFRAIKGYPEVKAAVLFNNAFDKNVPGGKLNYLDWTLRDESSFAKLLQHSEKVNVWPAQVSSGLDKQSVATRSPASVDHIGLGINYTKSESWFRNPNVLSKKDIAADFKRIKELGITTIKRYGPGVYDWNVLNAAKEFNLKVCYGFWIDDNIDFVNDDRRKNELYNEIVNTVRKYKANKQIINWNIGNSIWQTIGQRFYKPESNLHQLAYLSWLKKTVAAVKAADPSRPVTIDLAIDENTAAVSNFIAEEVPRIDAVSLIERNKMTNSLNFSDFKIPYFIGGASAQTYCSLKIKMKNFILGEWQDVQSNDYVTFNGLVDYRGRRKPEYYMVKSKARSIARLPEIRILKEARATLPGTSLDYNAVGYLKNRWQGFDKGYNQQGLKFEWFLVKYDSEGKSRYMKRVGEGPYLSLTIPQNDKQYRLRLLTSKGNNVQETETTLNTPL